MNLKNLEQYENTAFYFPKKDYDSMQFIEEMLIDDRLSAYFAEALEWNDFVVVTNLGSMIIIEIVADLDRVDSSSMKDYYIPDISDEVYAFLGMNKRTYPASWAVYPNGKGIYFSSSTTIDLK